VAFVSAPIAVSWLPEGAATVAASIALTLFVAVQVANVIGIADTAVLGFQLWQAWPLVCYHDRAGFLHLPAEMSSGIGGARESFRGTTGTIGQRAPDDLRLLPMRVIPWGDAASPSPIQQGNSHTQARPIQAMSGPYAGSDFPGYLAWSSVPADPRLYYPLEPEA
jgi:hypothetical protein